MKLYSKNIVFQETHLNTDLSQGQLFLGAGTGEVGEEEQKGLNLMFINTKGHFLPHLTNILVGTV